MSGNRRISEATPPFGQKKGACLTPTPDGLGRGRRASIVNRRAKRRERSVRDRHRAAVLGPRLVIVADLRGALLAVADDVDAVRRDTQRDERLLRGVGAPLAEAEVVLDGAALVAMALDGDRRRRILLKKLGLTLQDKAGFRGNVALI